ncbi:MAG: cyclic nucleotide-binding domain-containing protein [Lentisphaerae bacterium]|nr:cyclic nucleotide-binding domain-containing protein [Lentisphaerota bacterium]
MTQIIVLNLGYVMGLVALAIKDVLWLRIILMFSQSSMFSSALMRDNPNAACWNVAFVLFNLYHVVRIIRERRPIELPADLVDLYDRVFSSMSHNEFLYFWQTGQTCVAKDQMMIKKGDRQEDLSLILSGRVEVVKAQKKIAELERGSFIAEMSFLTGDPASADVQAVGEVGYISWQQEKLRNLKQLNPSLYMKIQQVLGKDLAGKVKAASKG